MKGFVYDDDSEIPPEPIGRSGGDHQNDSELSGSRWKAIAGVTLLVVAGLAALGVYAQQWKKSIWIREVVFSGNHLLSAEELMKKADGLIGKNLEEVDGPALTESYAALPYIRQAEVVKEMNGIVRVRVEERVPMAKVVSGDKVQVIDTEGYILPYRDFPPSSSMLLRVTGMKIKHVKGVRLKKADERSFAVLKEMIEAVTASEYARFLVRDITFGEGNKTYFIAAGSPTRFIVGNDGDYKEKLKKFEIFWQQVVAKKGLDGYAKVDLRFNKRVFAVENSLPGFHRISP